MPWGETLEYEFESDSIIVVFNKKTTRQLNDYEADDFDEVNAVEVDDLTKYSVEKYKGIAMSSSSDLDFNQTLEVKIESDGKEDVLEAISKLEDREDILYVQPNYIYTMCAVPNDSRINEQWAIDRIQLPLAWDIETGSSDLKVGVIDSGINAAHEDLKNVVDRNFSKSFVAGFNALKDDEFGHGTHVAGIIGAQGNNGKGVTGVCWNVNLVSLRVYGDENKADTSRVVNAINYAKEIGIKLLNYSSSPTTNDLALYKCLENYNGLFICAAGNRGIDIDSSNLQVFPACYNLDNIITVAATGYAAVSLGKEDYLCGMGHFSNYGKESVDLAAPGINILSTKGSRYIGESGTSMAAPYVTGVAALILSKYPDIPLNIVKSAILDNVDYVPELSGKIKTGGRLNAYKALSSLANKKFTLEYDCLDADGKGTSEVISFGVPHTLKKMEYDDAYLFSGWYVRCGSYALYTNGKDTKWELDSSCPLGYQMAVLEDGETVTVYSAPSDKTIRLISEWDDLILGDVDKDTEVTIFDATEIQRYIAKITQLDASQKEMADVDKDGEITIYDATAIQKYLAGIITEFYY